MRPIIIIFLSSFWAVTLAQGSEIKAQADIRMIETDVGGFYSSAATEQSHFPFSDMVSTKGHLIFLSGLVGTDANGELVSGGLAPETHAIFEQMQTYLAHLALDLTDIVKCLVMIDDIGKWAEFNAIYTNYFTPPYPARSAMGADGLALGAALELECIAVQRR